MFEREGDVSTFPSYYAAPLALVCGALALEGGDFAPAALLVSSIACLSGIASLSHVSTAPRANWVGLLGVAGAVAATLAQMDAEALPQALAVGGAGLGLGTAASLRAEVTDLPQMVALFHSFVGFAATAAAV